MNLLLIFCILLLATLASLSVRIKKQQEVITDLEEIVYSIAEDVNEVRTFTHGKPKINVPSIN